MTAAKLVWMLGADEGGPEGDRLRRLPLDTDGLGDLLAGLGFLDSGVGVGMAPLADAEAAPQEPVGELQRVVREHVAFERSTPGIEIVSYVHRVPGLTREEFHIRYRALGLRLRDNDGPSQLMARYAQNLVLGDVEGPDAVSELGFPDAATLLRFIGDPWLVETLLPYEAEFLDHPRTVQMLVRRQPSTVPATA